MNAAFGFLLISTWDSTTTENIFLTRFRINPLIPLPTPPPPPHQICATKKSHFA